MCSREDPQNNTKEDSKERNYIFRLEIEGLGFTLGPGIKGSSDPSHFIFEINLGKSRIRHTTTLKWNDEFLDRPRID